MAFRLYHWYRLRGYSRTESFLFAYEMRIFIGIGVFGLILGLFLPL